MMEFNEKLNNTADSSMEKIKKKSSAKEEKSEVDKSLQKNVQEQNSSKEYKIEALSAEDGKKKGSQLTKCDDKDLIKNDEDEEIYEEDDPYSESDDLLLKTGEYYHDHENYPIHIRFKHPFMNLISLLCGILSSVFCVCAAPAPSFNYLPSLWLILSALFSVLGIGLFVFDLVKSGTVNGLSIAGLILSSLGAALSAIMAFIIFVIFVTDITLKILGFGTTVVGIIGTIVAAIFAF